MPRHGILLVDKPAGVTSTAVLNRVKRLLAIRKAGHTGTLDPFATGLLALCFGEATKICGHLLDADKTYLASVRLGQTTTSGDPDGEPVAETEVPELDAAALKQVLAGFTGPIMQVPPMHSALKHQGRRLHELARAGKTVERQPRPVVIHELNLVDMDLPHCRIQVRCSKGTYIRVLAMDIGAAIGCGAHLTALRRTASGPFDLAGAITPDALEDLPPDERHERLLPPDRAFPEWPRITLDALEAPRFSNGQVLHIAAGHHDPGPVLVYDSTRLLGLGEIDAGGCLRAKRVFHLER